MKKNVRNALAISGIAIAIGTSSFAFEASANSDSSTRIQRSHQERILKTRKTENGERNFWGRRSILGIVTAVDGDSLTIKKGEKEFTVKQADAIRLLDRGWQTITFDQIKVNHKVRVHGTISDSIITAKTLRDISIN